MRPKLKIILTLSILPLYLFVKFLGSHPAWVESYYSRGLYVPVSGIQNFLFGWMPWSFGDIVYLLILGYLLYWVIFKMRQTTIKQMFLNLGVSLFLIYFLFHLLWGFNYYRESISTQLNLGNSCQLDELVGVTERLAESLNSVHLSITSNDSSKVEHHMSIGKIGQLPRPGFEHLNQTLNTGDLDSKRAKASLLSVPLTFMGFSGYLNPFTLEAQANHLVPSYSLAGTVAHEQAHQLGYAAENEANFIGVLACYYSKDSLVRYSGIAMALRICLNELYRLDKEKYFQIVGQLNYGILLNFEESRLFWDRYNNPLEPFFKSGYNQYLKSNAQKAGIQSYNEAVVLIVNFFKTDKT